MASVFFSYSHVDQDLRDQIETHLTMLKRQGVIETFHDRRIPAGNEVDHSISDKLESADVILLLVSSDFLASTYCYDVEMRRALERHESGAARVIPVILRRCDWQVAPFGKLMATPLDGKPIKSFPDLDEGFLQVVHAVRQAVTDGGGRSARTPDFAQTVPQFATERPSGPRSSNLKLPKVFTDADKDRFRDEAFEFIAKYFENSLAELANRNPGIEGTFKRIDANEFIAIAYKNGRKAAWCRIFMQGQLSSGIAFSASEHIGRGGFNESMSVGADEDRMFLKALGMAMHQSSGRLTFEGAAEQYWAMFVDGLRR
jgi:hypothetical protein